MRSGSNIGQQHVQDSDEQVRGLLESAFQDPEHPTADETRQLVESLVWKQKQLEASLPAQRDGQTLLSNPQQQLQMIVEGSGDIVVLHDLDGRYLFYAGPSEFGVVSEDLVGKTPRDLFPPEQAEPIMQQIRQVGESGQRVVAENQVTWNGRTLWFQDHIYAVRDDRGRIAGVGKTCFNVTQRKHIELELAASEASYRRLVDSIPHGILEIDTTGAVLFANASAETIFGYDNGELVGQHFSVLATSYAQRRALRREFNMLLDRANAEDRPDERKPYTMATRRKNGESIVCRVDWDYRRLPRGSVAGLIVVITDVTEQRYALDALRRSERRFRTLYEAMQVGVVTVDSAGRITHANRMACGILGSGIDAMRGVDPAAGDWQYVFDDGTPVSRDRHPVHVTRTTRRGTRDLVLGLFAENPVRRRWLLVSTEPVLNPQADALQEIIFSFNDITELQTVRRALDRERRQLVSIFEGIDEPIYVADPDTYELLYVNAAFEKQWGPGVGNLCYRALQNRDSPCPFCTNDRIFGDAAGSTYCWEFQNQRNGRWYRCIDKAVHWPDSGRLVRYEMAIDITERKLVEEELAKAKTTADEANRAKSQFLANMSHEIRTPMTAILGYTELLQAANLSVEERKQYASTIRRNGTLLLELINDILDLSRIEAGRVLLELQPCSPIRVVEEVFSLLQLPADEKGLSLDLNYGANVPTLAFTDPIRVRQILLNLVGNAIKFTDRGGVRLGLAFEPADERAARLIFSVSDTGPGLTLEQLDQLFRPFTQGDATMTRRFGGTGLGLVISKRLAHLLGGDIRVESTPGKGSTFIVTINAGPVDQLAREAARQEAEAATNGGQAPPLESAGSLCGRVLVVEDTFDTQQLIMHVLRNSGLQVDVAGNGEEACEMVLGACTQQNPYDLVLMDIQMPVMDGYEATRRLRKQGWKGPIVALTAHAMLGDETKCLEAGCDAYISKPVDLVALFATLARHLAPNQSGRG